MASAVGFIGLGMMGSALAKRLLAAGLRVVGYNRTKARAEALAPMGLEVAESIRDVVTKANIVFVSVTDNAASNDVFYGPGGIVEHARAETVIVDMSTISPEQSKAAAEAVRSRGGDMVDCPISGNPIQVEKGFASTMVGGRKETFDAIYSTLMHLGRSATLIGPNGKGLEMKVAVNMNLAVQIQGFAEAVLLAEKSGIPREVAVQVLTKSAVASPNIESRGPRILAMPAGSEDKFPTYMMQKDLNLALELGKAVGAPLPSVALANGYLTETRKHGWQDEDFVAVFFTLHAAAGGVTTALPRTQPKADH